jgi:hypothetical protein
MILGVVPVIGASMRAFADVIGERAVQPATLSASINTPADLTTLEHRHGL